MQVSTHRFLQKNQWGDPPDESLDSESTLLLFFVRQISST
jgi:hypothetical protein